MKNILFCGGGTLGPVTPLLAVIEAWREKDATAQFIFVGTPRGPEGELMAEEQIEFHCLPEAKLPRYPSLAWLFLPFRLLVAFYAAWLILKKEEPDLIVSAGGYTAVPMIICGWWQRIPALIHQQDARPLLSNKLSAPFAAVVTLAWPNLRKNFPKGHLLGNPVRSAFLRAKKDEGLKHFSLNENKPTVLVLGGGSGSLWLNRTVAEIIDQLLLQANLIHLTGKGKGIEGKGAADFRSFEFLTKEMPLAFAAADLVVCRAGMATITELAATKKAAIIVPLPNSPQEDNAAAINGAAVLLKQNQTTPAFLLEEIVRLLGDPRRRSEMGEALNKLLKTEVADDLVIIGQKIIAKNLKIGVDCC